MELQIRLDVLSHCVTSINSANGEVNVEEGEQNAVGESSSVPVFIQNLVCCIPIESDGECFPVLITGKKIFLVDFVLISSLKRLRFLTIFTLLKPISTIYVYLSIDFEAFAVPDMFFGDIREIILSFCVYFAIFDAFHQFLMKIGRESYRNL
jgi:hypothetical protein